MGRNRINGIRQADGDNPIAVRGCMIVKQTTENQKKSKLINRKKLKGCVYYF